MALHILPMPYSTKNFFLAYTEDKKYCHELYCLIGQKAERYYCLMGQKAERYYGQLCFFLRYGKEEVKKSSLQKRAERVLAGQEDEGEGSEDEEDIEPDDNEERRRKKGKEEDTDFILFQKLHGNMTQQVGGYVL